MISPGTIVNEVGTGRQGLVCETNPIYCTAEDGEEPLPQVLFFDSNIKTRVTEVPERQLIVVGPENAIADMALCSDETSTCAYLMSCSDQVQCGRSGKLRLQLLARKIGFYIPVQKFPDCQRGSPQPDDL